MKTFDHWMLKKEGPLDDPEHALFGDFDHIPGFRKDIEFYAKQRAANGGKKFDPFGATVVVKSGDTDSGPQDATVVLKRIDDLEKRINSVETALSLHGKHK